MWKCLAYSGKAIDSFPWKDEEHNAYSGAILYFKSTLLRLKGTQERGARGKDQGKPQPICS